MWFKTPPKLLIGTFRSALPRAGRPRARAATSRQPTPRALPRRRLHRKHNMEAPPKKKAPKARKNGEVRADSTAACVLWARSAGDADTDARRLCRARRRRACTRFSLAARARRSSLALGAAAARHRALPPSPRVTAARQRALRREERLGVQETPRTRAMNPTVTRVRGAQLSLGAARAAAPPFFAGRKLLPNRRAN
jgi:hypothetical protein